MENGSGLRIVGETAEDVTDLKCQSSSGGMWQFVLQTVLLLYVFTVNDAVSWPLMMDLKTYSPSIPMCFQVCWLIKPPLMLGGELLSTSVCKYHIHMYR